jgi:phosphatidylserine decarboxylase
VGFLAIGMAEVSSCEVVVSEGQHVEKGDQLGMFHFGGSSHCLIFGPHVTLDFDLHGQAPNLNAVNIPVRDRIAIVR